LSKEAGAEQARVAAAERLAGAAVSLAVRDSSPVYPGAFPDTFSAPFSASACTAIWNSTSPYTD
jgi:hypothetical protein